MPILPLRPSPLTVLAAALVVGGGVGLIRQRAAEPTATLPCDPLEVGCEVDPGYTANVAAARTGGPPRLTAQEACPDTGYLCAELARVARIRLQRWRAIDGPLVVHVPRPELEDGIDPVALQQAALLGVRAWNNQPFPILVDTRGDRSPHFAISWKGTLSGTQIGVARTRWSLEAGLGVVSIELAMRNPYDPTRMNDPVQVRLTAAHEMGHALGLGHSDSERDVMYPTNTASAVSARDRRTMEALYELMDGTEISR